VNATATPVPSERERLARAMDQIHNPVAFATSYLARRRLLGHADEDELLDVAIQSIIDAALAWNPNGGRSVLSWAYLYLDRNIYRAIGRRHRERSELGREADATDAAQHWLEYRAGIDWYDRIELRADLQRWADLAELTPYMRFVVQYAAYHKGVYVRDTALAGSPNPLHAGGSVSYKLALGQLRRAAITNRRRDDRWTRWRSGAANAARAAERITTEVVS
jgi:hypothetical protein